MSIAVLFQNPFLLSITTCSPPGGFIFCNMSGKSKIGHLFLHGIGHKRELSPDLGNKRAVEKTFKSKYVEKQINIRSAFKNEEYSAL